MMANMPILQEMAAALPVGKAKATVMSEAAVMDFSTMLAGLNAGNGEPPGQAVAIAHRPECVTAMLAERHGVQEKPAEASTVDPVDPQPAPSLKKLALTGQSPASNILAELDVLKGKFKQAVPAGDQPAKAPAAAPTTALLPTAALPVVTDETETAEAELPVIGEDDIVPSDEQPNVQLADGAKALVLPAAAPVISAPPAARLQPKTERALDSGKPVNMPGMLPGWAAEPAQIHAQVGKLQSGNPGKAMRSSAGNMMATHEAANRQALALELAALSLGNAAPREVPAATEQPDTGSILSVPVGLAKAAETPPAATAHPVNITAPLNDMAAVFSPGIPAADTAAVLSEQVIDMGVDGQWIDRMAREIADVAAGTGRATFTLHPQNLGKLQVEILQREEGADVRMITETDAAAAALNQGRHQLQQDARLQAVRINDVQVERAPADRAADNVFTPRAQSSGQEMTGQQGQSQAFYKKPQIESVSSRVTEQEQDQAASERTGSRQARYA